MKIDPPVRANGLCAQCGKPRKPPARKQRGVDPAVYVDPFCSAECCRAYHNLRPRQRTQGTSRAAASREGHLPDPTLPAPCLAESGGTDGIGSLPLSAGSVAA